MRLCTRIDFKSEASQGSAGSLPILFVTSAGNPDSADQLLVVEQRKAATNGHQFLNVCERRELGIGDVVVPDVGCYSAGGSGPGLADSDLRGEEWRTVRPLECAQVAGGVDYGNCGVKAHVATSLRCRLD